MTPTRTSTKRPAAGEAPAEPSTRERILEATARLFQRQGYAGTGMKQIAAESGAPFGSIYHFFPGGKDQLSDEVIRLSGRMYAVMLAPVLTEAADPVTAARDFFDGAAQTLRDTDYADACPIAAVALEVASTNERLRLATAEVFEGWIGGCAAYFEQAGIAGEQARGLAVAMLSLLEGAFVFSRAKRDTEALEVAGELFARQVEAALAG
jgi:AcrR family transcriptional regulator